MYTKYLNLTLSENDRVKVDAFVDGAPMAVLKELGGKYPMVLMHGVEDRAVMASRYATLKRVLPHRLIVVCCHSAYLPTEAFRSDVVPFMSEVELELALQGNHMEITQDAY